MAKFYSASTGGFYLEAVHGVRNITVDGKNTANPASKIPLDAVAVTDTEYEALLVAIASGSTLNVSTAGKVTTTAYVAAEFDVMDQIRAERDNLLTACDWTQLGDAPLSADQVAAWKTYRQALRDLPASLSPGIAFADVVWPTIPA